MAVKILSFLIIFSEQINLFLENILGFSFDFSIVFLNIIILFVCLKRKVILINKDLLFLFLLFSIACLMSYVTFKNFDGIFSLIKLLFYFSFSIFLLCFLKIKNNLKIFLKFSVHLLIIICIFYVFLVLLANTVSLTYENSLLKFYDEHGFVRVAFVFNEPLLMSLYFSIGAAFSIYLDCKKSFFLFLLGSVLTFSITGVTLVFTLLFIYLLRKLSFAKFMLFGTSLILLLSYLIMFFYLERLNSIALLTDGSTRIRIASAYASIMMFLENPFFGVGFGNSKFLIESFSGLFKLSFQHTDLKPANGYFLLLSEVGLVGFLIFSVGILLSLSKHKGFSAPLVLICVYFISSAIMLLPIIFAALISPMLMFRSNLSK